MSMKAFDDFRDKLCEEFEKIARKPEMSAGDLETAHKLTDTIKNIDKICIMDETGGYSQAGDWEARGRFGDMYAQDDGYSEGGNSYRGGNSQRGQRRDSMGRYSRDDGMSYRGGSSQRRGGYSRGGGLMEHVEMMMDEAENDEQREAIRRFKKQLKEM